MNFQNYQPPNKWTGREDTGSRRLHQAIQCVDLRNDLSNLSGYGILGFCCDEGVKRNQGRPGAAEGPSALRKALSNLPIRDISAYDLGDILCPGSDLEQAQEDLSSAIETLHTHNIRPIVLGGGHEVAWGHFRGIANAYPGRPVSVVNIDAHYDLRPLNNNQGSSGTSFTQMAAWCEEMGVPFNYTCIGTQKTGNTPDLFDRAENLGVQTIFAEDLHTNGIGSVLEAVDAIISKNDLIYITICLDAFASPYAPGVSAPQILGLTPWQIIPLLQKFATSGKIIGLDVAELSPKLDENAKTAQLGAALISQILM